MTRKLRIIIGASTASALALSVLAQDTSNIKTDAPARERAPYSQRYNRLNDVAKASDIIGITVKNNQDQKLGGVSDLSVDVDSGRITEVILSTGGFLGVGNDLRAVPPGAFTHDKARKILVLDADKEKLKAAPKFDLSHWSEYSDSKHLAAVYRYYDETPAFQFVQTTVNSPNSVASRNPGGTWDKDRTIIDSRGMIPSSRLAEMQSANKILGAPVRNLQGQRLGKVENLMVDLPAGRIVTVIVSSGGFLGMGDEYSAIPPTALRFDYANDRLQLDASQETLRNAPHFKPSDWPNFNQSAYTAGVYNAYHVEPYFAVNDTGINVRDRNGRTLTPADQGNDKVDIGITARIRKEIVALKDISVDARNVKIITVNGYVTLRGPVNTLDEKRRIADIADRIAGAQNVDNQLEVKLASNNS
jgi:sporulation protein YlmC with PRC-barrel domain